MGKGFFFEKKNQKTFDLSAMGVVRVTPMARMIKVFLLLFVHKKKCFLT